MRKRILAIFAHPDDEAFGVGGTLARCAAEGHAVELVSATRGEAGEISDDRLATAERLGEVREQELRCAAKALGIQAVHFLDYCDSGMDGTDLNRSPLSFVNADAHQVQSKLVEIMRQFRPEVVITFEPNGGYGHPDHIAIHQHTVKAVDLAADERAWPGLGAAHRAERLFFTGIPQSFFAGLRETMERLGLDASDLAWLEKAQPDAWEAQINFAVDVSAYVDAKWRALECHATQFGPQNLFRRVPAGEMRQLMSVEYFWMARPDAPSGQLYPDLLADFSIASSI